MENWLLFVLISVVAWGSYSVLVKIVTSKNYFGIDPRAASLLALIGIIIVFSAFFMMQPQAIPTKPTIIIVGILAGAIWAVGQIFSFIVLSRGADVAKVAPLYNINALLAVLLGIVLLGELPTTSQLVKVVVGAILIIVGSILVII